jgi:hypothetical protein
MLRADLCVCMLPTAARVPLLKALQTSGSSCPDDLLGSERATFQNTVKMHQFICPVNDLRMESILTWGAGVQIAYGTTVAIRFANNIIGGENFIDLARYFGVQ